MIITQAKIILLSISLIFSLLAAEIILRLFLPQPTLSSLEQNNPHCYIPSQVLTFSLKPNCVASYTSAEFSTTIRINSLGFRGREFTLAKPQGQHRTLIVGDSMTFGHGVDQDQTYAQQLEALLSQTQVINAGFASGFSPDNYYIYLKHNLPQLQPDLVIFPIFVLNDITDLKDNTVWMATDSAGLPTRVVDKNRHVTNNGFLVNNQQSWYYGNQLTGNLHIVVLLGRSLDKLVYKLSTPTFPLNPKTALDYYLCLFDNQCFPEMENTFDNVNKLILASHNLSLKYKAKFLLLLIPADVQVDPTAWEKYGAGRFGLSDPPYPQARFIKFAQSQGIDYLDLLPEFLLYNQGPLFFRLDGHLNSVGHSLVAKIIADHLLKTGYK